MKVAVAYIKGPRGFKGELAAVAYRTNTGSLRPGISVTLRKNDDTLECAIEAVIPLQNRLSLKFSGIDDEREALKWRGADVLVDRDNLEMLDAGEYYHFDLEGADVVEESGKSVGKVKGVESFPGNDVLTVETDHGEILVPFVKAVIRSVDVENKRIIIGKLEGLY